MNLNEFKSKMGEWGGPMRTNRFLVRMATPLTMLNRSAINRNLEFWCDQVNWPGFLIGTHDVRRYTYGPIEKRPHIPNFTQLQCSFINDSTGFVWDFFNEWMQSIIPHTTVGETISGMSTPQNGGLVYELEYKNNYATDISIDVFDTFGTKTYSIVCREAFPVQVPDLPLNWGDTNNLFRFQVILDFVDWYVDYSEGPIGGTE